MSFLMQIVISPGSGHAISFILSYMALAGILIIGEAVGGLLAGKAPAFLYQPLSASIGAFLATAGIIVFFFNVLQPIGIVIGLVLVPLTTVFIAGALAWLVLDLVSPLFSGFVTLPLTLLYRMMEKTVSIGGIVPGIDVSRPMAILAVSLAVSLFIVWLEMRRRKTASQLLPFG
jgi:competence protein ComEC